MSSDYFQGKYRISSARLQSWNYGSEGMYFVTICVAGMQCVFGKITEGIVILNGLGQTAFDEWTKTPELRPDMNLQVGEFVVMPNHFHGILMIGENEYNGGGVDGAWVRRDVPIKIRTSRLYG